MSQLSESALRAALRRAFSLGEKHWQQADSESYAENKRANDTLIQFQALIAETLAAAHDGPLVPIERDSRKGMPPCGECHLQPGETCDVCGAQAPHAPEAA